MQNFSQVEVQISRVDAQRFFCDGPFHAAALKFAKNLFANGLGEPLELSANGRFMNAKQPRDLEERSAIEEI